MRLTVEEYCKKFKVSREMLSSKLKARQLNYIIENNTTYIIVADKVQNSLAEERSEQTPQQSASDRAQVPSRPKTTVATVLALYQRENQQLKEKIVQLEKKIDKLIDDKEQMLRDEMQKIEQVYSAKDEQLKTILELVNTKLMMDQSHDNIHTVETLSNEKIENNGSKLVELKSYIRTLDLKSYQRKIIRKRFLAVKDNDIRIIQQNGNIYLDFSKYDYSDLLEY